MGAVENVPQFQCELGDLGGNWNFDKRWFAFDTIYRFQFGNNPSTDGDTIEIATTT